jgi:hypothetical protein
MPDSEKRTEPALPDCKVCGTSGKCEHLQLLFDYTKMHIELYTAIATVFAASIASRDLKLDVNHVLMGVAISFICAAGLAGGVVASTIPHLRSLYGTGGFWESGTGPFFRGQMMRGEYWTYAEHTAFWIAVVSAGAAVWLGKSS